MQKMVRQVRHPKGLFGKIMARGMNFGHAKLAGWALSKIEIPVDAKILDVGCGGGANIKRMAKLAPQGQIYGIDHSFISVVTSENLNRRLVRSGHVSIAQGSVSSMPYEDNTFDIVTGFEAYYFWPDLAHDFQEIKRVLKPEAVLMLANEAYMCENSKIMKRNQKWAQDGDFELHTPAEFHALITDAGFSEIQIFEEHTKGWIVITGKK